MLKWEPSEDDYQEVLLAQSPWLTDGSVPEEWARQAERPLAQMLHRRLDVEQLRRFHLILGPRRVGKTTVMYQTVRHLLRRGVPRDHIRWLRLDHPLLMEIPLGARVGAWCKSLPRGSTLYLFLDELTYARDWDLWLKTFYDEHWPVCVVATSSSSAAIQKRAQESGVGRWEEQFLPPYSFHEYLGLISAEPPRLGVKSSLAATLRNSVRLDLAWRELDGHRLRFLLTGGFPELLMMQLADEATALLHSQRVLHGDAVERAIYKDIPQAYGVDNPMLLERLLFTVAGQFTGLLSPAKLCQSLGGLSQPTLDKYLGYLERAFLIFTLPNYSGSEASVQKRGRKVYFVDGAVRNAALQRGLRPLQDSIELGHLLENLIASHLYSLGQLTQVRLYHWRDGKSEVDLVYDHPDEPLAFEVASSHGHSRAGLVAFQERYPRFRGRCYLVVPNQPGRPPDDSSGIGTISLNHMLLACGATTEDALRRRLSFGSDQGT